MTVPTATMLEHEIGEGGLFAIRLHSSDVRLRGVDGPFVRVRASSGTLEGSMRVDRGPDSLSMRAERGLSVGIGSFGIGIGIGVGRRTPDLEVDVPRRATVVLETASGDVTVDGLSGAQRYSTASGGIVLRDVGGSLSLQAISGKVDLVAAQDCAVAARTVSGDLSVRGDPIGSLQVSSTSGDVRLQGRLAGPGPFDIETVSGDAIIAPTGGLRVVVKSVTGDVRSEVSTATAGGAGARVLVFAEGGPTLTIRSMSGDVRLVAAGDLSVPRQSEPPATEDGARLDILAALERGDIDVAEASRRLDALDAAPAPETTESTEAIEPPEANEPRDSTGAAVPAEPSESTDRPEPAGGRS
jgi:hypothetical protein